MQVQISKWGNSLGLRLPKALAEQVGLGEGQKVTIVARGNEIVVQPVKPSYRLEDLLTNVDPKALREAFDWGPDVGRERVDE